GAEGVEEEMRIELLLHQFQLCFRASAHHLLLFRFVPPGFPDLVDNPHDQDFQQHTNAEAEEISAAYKVDRDGWMEEPFVQLDSGYTTDQQQQQVLPDVRPEPL